MKDLGMAAGVLFAAIMGALGGAIVVAVLAVLVMFVTGYSADWGAPVGAVVGGIGAPTALVLVTRREDRVELAKAEAQRDVERRVEEKKLAETKAARERKEKLEQQRVERHRQQAEAQELRRIEAVAQNRRFAEEAVRRNAARAAAEFSALPTVITHVEEAHASARHHFSEGAFSPFWSSIESAYTDLGQFNVAVRSIGDAAEAHPEKIDAFRSEYGNADHLPGFPVDLTAINAFSVGTTLAKGLERTVYEAQKHVVFAQIWEQRRTTAAVVAGFRSMDQAIAGMAQRLASQVDALAQLASANPQTLTGHDPQIAEVVHLLERQDLRARGMLSDLL